MIFVGGYHASGKSYLAGVLENEFSCLHIETSAIVRNMWLATGTDENLQDWAAKMEGVHGDTYFDRAIAQTIEFRYVNTLDNNREVTDVVVTGNRSLEGVKYLADYFEDTPLGEKPNKIIAVKTPFENLLERYRARNRREGDATITEQDFRALTLSETRRGLEDILGVADHTLYNDGSREIFKERSIVFFEKELELPRKKDYAVEYAQHTLDGQTNPYQEFNYRKNV